LQKAAAVNPSETWRRDLAVTQKGRSSDALIYQTLLLPVRNTPLEKGFDRLNASIWP